MVAAQVSMQDQLDMYEDDDSPHKMPMYPMSGAYLDAHHTWYQHRERYATAPIGEEGDYAREVHMEGLLKSVTLENPPVNRINLNPPPQPVHCDYCKKPRKVRRSAVLVRRPRSTSRMAAVFILTYIGIMFLWILIVMAIT